jgi:GT2 family glycosyltransferase
MLDAADVVGDQLAALAAQDYPGGWEVVVADNGSRDGGPDIVRDWAAARLPNLRLVDAADRPGSAHARNVGTAAARGDLILYTDADDVVAPGWVSAMSRAAAGAWLLAGSDSPLRGNGRAAAPASRAPSFLPWGRGGNMGVRREAFEAVGGWDEERLRGQDVDFSWRLQLAGYPLRFVPDARAWYRRPRTLWGLARHQFEFGARAPVLYRDFRAYGARRRSPRRTLRGLAWVITRVPYLAMSDEYRRRWVRMAAGMAGRGWGTLRCWLERPKSRS